MERKSYRKESVIIYVNIRDRDVIYAILKEINAICPLKIDSSNSINLKNLKFKLTKYEIWSKKCILLKVQNI